MENRTEMKFNENMTIDELWILWQENQSKILELELDQSQIVSWICGRTQEKELDEK